MTQIENNEGIFRIATLASSVSNYKAELLFDGETQSSGKKYKVLYPASTYLLSGYRVLCVRVSGSWVVLGAIR